MNKNKKSAKEILKSGKQMMVPCAYDVISAKAMELCGFDGVLISDGALGYTHGKMASPDETIRIVESICRAISIPVFVDAGDGLSENAAGVYHNMKRLVQAGAAGFSIEDGAGGFMASRTKPPIPFKETGEERGSKDLFEFMQPIPFPKSMTQLLGRGRADVIDKEDWWDKITASVMACEGSDAFVIARCHAYDKWGFDGVVERIKGAMKCGAEMWTVCMGGCWKEEEGRMWSEAIPGHWQMWPDLISNPDSESLKTTGKKHNVELDVLMDMGFNFVTFHIAEKGQMYGLEKFGKEIFESKSTASLDNALVDGLTPAEVEDFLNMNYRQIMNLELKYIKG